MTNMELVAYCRVSQDKTGAGMAVERQEASIREWASKNGHTIGALYSDNDTSATSGKVRPGFEALLDSGHDQVVVWHQDRLLRVSKDLERILDAGLVVHQVMAGSLDLKTTQGRAMARTITAWATHEVEQKADRQRAGNKQAAEAGKPYWRAGIRPYGLNMDGTLHPEEGPALELAVERILDGAGLSAICRDLTAKGLTPLRAGKRGTEFHPSSLRRILTNPRICGVRVYKGVEYPGNWEAIISPETFAALQLELTTRERPRKSKSRENLLSGIAICGLCGGSMGQSRSSTAQGSTAAYRCSKFKHCSKQADPTDDFVRDQTLLALSMPETLDALGADTASIHDLRAERAAEVARWNAWLEEAAEADLRPSEYVAPRGRHEAKLRGIEERLLKAEKSNLFGDDFGLVAVLDTPPEGRQEVWGKLPLEKRRKFVQTVWQSITLHPSPRGRRGFDSSTVLLVPSEATAAVMTDENIGRHLQGQLLERLGFTAL